MTYEHTAILSPGYAVAGAPELRTNFWCTKESRCIKRQFSGKNSRGRSIPSIRFVSVSDLLCW